MSVRVCIRGWEFVVSKTMTHMKKSNYILFRDLNNSSSQTDASPGVSCESHLTNG